MNANNSSLGTSGVFSRRTRIWFHVVAFLALWGGEVIAEQFGNFTYSANAGVGGFGVGVIITGYSKSVTSSVLIPEKIEGRLVTGIGNGAFKDCAGLTSVTIPNSVTSIGNYAFNDCNGLTAINVSHGSSTYTSVDGVLFNKNQSTLISYPRGKAGSYTIPNSVISTGSYAFEYCAGLTGLTIPKSVNSIGNSAFRNCTGLKRVYFQGNAPDMGTSVFSETNSQLTLYFFNGRTGFTKPTWQGEPAVELNGPASMVDWLVFNGFSPDAPMFSDPNGDGISLLMAYALNLDPDLKLAGSMPQPVQEGSQLRMSFPGNRSDIIYKVETSTDLKVWTTSRFTRSLPNGNGIRSASVGVTGVNRFMRLRVTRS